ncbi:uncharacterized protein B0T15DRAFT_517156 [Chaetomium strumarium]|uniref:Uncharacterized protein n=1 Tax=Chaetomium strumarium TaxID=1170767 RepID=A0AAJ0M5N3_9PEZI|nr:hypothetical protein B0T15DRAFT_517156 [Chaetomium strumarium]
MLSQQPTEKILLCPVRRFGRCVFPVAQVRLHNVLRTSTRSISPAAVRQGKRRERSAAVGTFTAHLHDRQLYHVDLHSDWRRVSTPSRSPWSGRRSLVGWMADGDRVVRAACSCRPTRSLCPSLRTRHQLGGSCRRFLRPTSPSDSTELALNSNRPRPIGSALLHCASAALRRQWALMFRGEKRRAAAHSSDSRPSWRPRRAPKINGSCG